MHSLRPSDVASLADEQSVFQAIDRRALCNDGDRWVAAVLAVHRDEQQWWIDVAPATNPAANVVVRVSRRAAAHHVLAALDDWRRSGERRPGILHVMCDAASGPVCAPSQAAATAGEMPRRRAAR